MIAVISDLHFREDDEDLIPVPGDQPIGRRRNLRPIAYVQFIRRLAEEARRNGGGRGNGSAGTKELHLVLAGDIFEVQRTVLWFKNGPGGPMPYDDPPAPGMPLEAMTLRVLDAIAADERVKPTLEAFRRLAQGEYDDGGATAGSFPADEVHIHYLPGNHDRLCQATPAIREWVRNALGMPASPDPFPHQVQFRDPAVLVRHGHEYDPRAFGTDYSKTDPLPDPIPAEAYAEPALGDFVSVQIAARLPYEFRRYHTDARILATPLLANVYDRLLEFDDVRPQSALVQFLLTDPDIEGVEDEAWAAVEPVLRIILESLRRDRFLRAWLRRKDRPWRLDRSDLLQAALDLRVWRHGVLTREVAERLVSGGEKPRPPVELAAREPAIQDGRARFVVAGHTHEPTVELALPDRDGGRYYVDIGTWRNRIPAAPFRKGFGRLKALTYVIFYGSAEDPGGDPSVPKLASFDYWSGFTQRFPVD